MPEDSGQVTEAPSASKTPSTPNGRSSGGWLSSVVLAAVFTAIGGIRSVHSEALEEPDLRCGPKFSGKHLARIRMSKYTVPQYGTNRPSTFNEN
jgi:hypothetical protein